MTPAQKNFLLQTIRDMKSIMSLYGELVELDALWAGPASFSTQFNQATIDSDPTFAGLTAQNLADVEAVLSNIKNSLTAALPPISVINNIPG